MQLDHITPVILTRNEEPNIGRVLSGLAWATDVVVVDSHSTDGTLEILRRFANVRMFLRAFDNHTAQWRYATRETEIETTWILTLDADYVLSDEFVREMAELEPAEATMGYEARFRYRVYGRILARSIYPPRIVLYRRGHGSFHQDGHTQCLAVEGEVRRLQHPIEHDDRKSITHWIRSQDRYARLEREKLLSSRRSELRGADRLRTWRIMAPLVMLAYCLFYKRLIFAGLPGWYYTYQRVVAELLLSLYMIEERLLGRTSAERRAADLPGGTPAVDEPPAVLPITRIRGDNCSPSDRI